MSFKRLDAEDIVVSSDSVTSPCWSNNSVTLDRFYTAITQTAGNSGDYYYNVYNENPTGSTATIQFSTAFGSLNGNGSLLFNPNVTTASPASVIYKQMNNLVLGDEDTNFLFNGVSGSHIYVLSIERSRYKEKLLPASLTLSLVNGANSVTITDNSKYVGSVTYTDAGRVYELISGSQGVRNSSLQAEGFTNGAGSYGKFLPDVGLIILNGLALDAAPAIGGISLATGLNNNTDDLNNLKIFNAIAAGANFKLRSEETVSSNFVFIRARNSEFNYSTNPSNITGSGELRHDLMVDSPQAYATSVGLYNDNNDLLAVAKFSKPLLKDFTIESLVRIKLDY